MRRGASSWRAAATRRASSRRMRPRAGAGIRAARRSPRRSRSRPTSCCAIAIPMRKRARSRRLATWTLRFTPHASLAPPDAVVAEIGGSLRLFGGLPRLVARLTDGAHAQGYATRLGARAHAHGGARSRARRACARPSAIRANCPRALGAVAARAARHRSRYARHAARRPASRRSARPTRCRATRSRAAAATALHCQSRSRLRAPCRSARAVRAAAALRKPARAAGAGRPTSKRWRSRVNRLVHELAAWLTARGLGALRLTLTLMHEHYLQRRGIDAHRSCRSRSARPPARRRISPACCANASRA